MAKRSKQQTEVENPQPGPVSAGQSQGYLVVARRYRPQTFDELAGQDHVASALKNAISSGRIGHAYLFAGARGVGKTSTARIFAKALNCVRGPTPEPCNVCDICKSISAGEDIDVLEIDGASNRGIEEIRQLRQNVVVRPSRARFKIYIIDEVHMLTKEAFNALLKTLEEPPEHVKFIFCTTEPNKVPVTILSRCQRFDFAGIEVATIVTRLQQIVQAEGVSVEPGVLQLLARRAGGSMRDAQSLLEQLLAFADQDISLNQALDLLGMTRAETLQKLMLAAGEGNAAVSLAIFHQALNEGADAALLLEQLLTYQRDCMVASLGCQGEVLLSVGPGELPIVAEIGKQWGLPRLLAGMQVLDYALGRMKFATHDRVLAEMAIIRLARLGELAYVQQVIEWLRKGQFTQAAGQPAPAVPPPAAFASRPAAAVSQAGANVPPAAQPSCPSHAERAAATSPETPAPWPAFPSTPAPSATAKTGSQAIDEAKSELQRNQAAHRQAAAAKASPVRSPQGQGTPPELPLTPENAAAIWSKAAESVGGMASDHARQFCRATVLGDKKLVITFRKDKAFCQKYCTNPAVKAKFERAVRALAGPEVELEIALAEEDETEVPAVPASERSLFDLLQEPMVRKAADIFGARPVAVLPPEQKSDLHPRPAPQELLPEEEHQAGDFPEELEDEDDLA